jgi:hypothetical protein
MRLAHRNRVCIADGRVHIAGGGSQGGASWHTGHGTRRQGGRLWVVEAQVAVTLVAGTPPVHPITESQKVSSAARIAVVSCVSEAWPCAVAVGAVRCVLL